MAIGYVPGAALLSNLDRQGSDLSFTTSSQTLAYLDFTNYRFGINNANPQYTLDVTGNINTTGTVILAGNLAVNNGNLTTLATTFNLVNTTATTLNFAGAATSLNFGANTGTITIKNPTVVGTETTQNLYNTTATTLNFAGAATAINIGATTGIVTISNPTVVGTQSIANLWNTTATTVNAFGAATSLNFGANTGTITIKNPTVVGTETTQNLYNTTATTLNFAGAATSLNFGANTGTITISNPTVVGTQSTQNLYNTTATTVNAFGAATSLNFGANTGTITISNPTVVGTETTQNLYNTTATTVNAFGAATAINIGATTGTATISNPTVVGTQSTQNLYNTTATTLNFAGAATAINIGATTGTATISNPTLVGIQSTQNLYNTTATTLNFAGAATTLTIAATTGNTAIRNNLNVGLTVQAQDINNTVIGNVVPAAATFTTATVQGNTSLGLTSAAAINNTPIGNATPSTGSFTTLVSSGVTQVTNTSTATSVGTGAFRVDGGASVSGNLWVGGNINVVGNTFVITGNSGQFFGDINGFGALYAGVAGFTSLPQTVFQVAADVNNYAQINFENVNTGTDASVDYVATSGNGDDTNHYINMGITSPNWDGTQENSLSNSLSGNDGYLYVQGDTGSGGNLVIGASTLGRTVSVIVGGNTASNITAVYRAPGTASTNTTTGALTVVGGVGILGNVYANNLSTTGGLSAADLTLSGDLGVNGGDITTTASTFNLIDSTVATVNAFGSATAIDLGATTGTLTINNPTVVGTQPTQNLYNTTATTLNFAGAATAINIGATTGTATINNPTVVGTQPTQNLYNTTATTLNFAGAATTLIIGATTGIANIRNATTNIIGNATVGGNLAVNGADLTTIASTFNLINTNATTINAFGDATTLTVGATTGTLTLRNATVTTPGQIVTTRAGNATTGNGQIFLNGSTSNRIDWATAGTGAPAFTTRTDGTKVVLYPALSGSTVDYAIGIDSATLWSSVPENGNSFNFKWYGAETLVANLSGTGNFTTVGDVAVNGGDLTTTAATFNLVDTDATTVNFAGAATAIDLGATSGTLTINNPVVVGTQSTANLWNTTTTTVNAFGAATSINIGATTGTLTIQSNTGSTSNTTGALVVNGGVGFAKNVYVGTGITINSTQSAENFTVKGVNATSLIVADSSSDSVIIGGSNATPISGATLKINGTDSIILPIGSTAERPGLSGNVDVAGMFRYNSTGNIIEFYDGTIWQQAGPTFTIVADRQFVGNVFGGFGNVNGTNNTFTLPSASTTSSTLVSVNGLIKLPVADYNVTSSTLTFVTPPITGSVIDARCLTATTTVDYISSGNGINRLVADNTGITFLSGPGEVSLNRIILDQEGIITYENNTKHAFNSPVVSIGTGPVVIDTFDKTIYRSAKYNITTTNLDSSEFETTEVLVIHNGTTAYKTQYATLYTGSASLGSITVAVNGANVELSYAGVAANNSVKTSTTYITI